MKTLIAIAALILPLTASAQVSPRTAAAREDFCIAVGELAHTVATKRLEGATEAKLLNLAPASSTTRLSRYIIKLSFTMQWGPDQARQMTYMRCTLGDFDGML